MAQRVGASVSAFGRSSVGLGSTLAGFAARTAYGAALVAWLALPVAVSCVDGRRELLAGRDVLALPEHAVSALWRLVVVGTASLLESLSLGRRERQRELLILVYSVKTCEFELLIVALPGASRLAELSS